MDLVLGSPRPAFTEPDDNLPDDGMITIEYTEKTWVRARLTPEQAREAFGLGGTPDGEVGARLTAITRYSPTMLARLGPHSVEERQLSWELAQLRDPYEPDTYL
jgi:hypothetical protein